MAEALMFRGLLIAIPFAVGLWVVIGFVVYQLLWL